MLGPLLPRKAPYPHDTHAAPHRTRMTMAAMPATAVHPVIVSERALPNRSRFSMATPVTPSSPDSWFCRAEKCEKGVMSER
jgi:hypothetical protein